MPGIEIFLKETLAAEKLSVTTEKQRNFYIECITHAKAVSYVCANRGKLFTLTVNYLLKLLVLYFNCLFFTVTIGYLY